MALDVLHVIRAELKWQVTLCMLTSSGGSQSPPDRWFQGELAGHRRPKLRKQDSANTVYMSYNDSNIMDFAFKSFKNEKIKKKALSNALNSQWKLTALK